MMGNKLNWINFKGNKDNIDYNQLSNKPIKKMVGTMENPIRLWKLMSGLYLINGFIQHSDTEISEYYEKEELFISVFNEVQEDKCIVSCFVPFWEAQYDYTMMSFDDETYTEHQIVKILMEGDIKVPSKVSELANDCNYITEDNLNNILSFDKEGNLIVTINGVTKKFLSNE